MQRKYIFSFIYELLFGIMVVSVTLGRKDLIVDADVKKCIEASAEWRFYELWKKRCPSEAEGTQL